MKDFNGMDDKEFELAMNEIYLAQRKERRQYTALLIIAGLFSIALLVIFVYAISEIWN
jgi:hypothetical protein